jgi:peptidoglycan/xylan/chitin deacetylase (PgdA/CDA1 family)
MGVQSTGMSAQNATELNDITNQLSSIITLNSLLYQDYIVKEGYSFEKFNIFSQWSKAEGDTIESDTTYTKNDYAAALKINVTTSGAYTSADKTINRLLTKTNKILTMWVYLHNNPWNLASIQIYLSSVSNFATYYSGTVNALNMKEGWNLAVFDANAFTTSNGESWDNTMIKMRVRVNARATYTCSVTLSDMQCNIVSTPKIILTFDDGSDGVVYKAYPYMVARNIKGTCYINPVRVGTAGYATLSQLTSLYSWGWDMGNHSYNHPDFTGMTQAEIEEEFQTAQDWLIENGFERSAYHVSIPNGIWNDDVRTSLVNIGALTARNSNECITLPVTMDLYMIPPMIVEDTTSVATITGWIDRAIANNETLVLMFHQIKDTPTNTYDYATADFQSVIDYIYDNEYGDYVVAMSEFYTGLNRSYDAL